MRSRSGSEASVLSIHCDCAGVSGARGSNGPGRVATGGAGNGVGAGFGGTDATTVDVVVGAGAGFGVRVQDVATMPAHNRTTAALHRGLEK